MCICLLLNCSFFFLQVSWVRRSGDKMHLLSYGQQVYSSDDRYGMKFHQPNDWQLQIQYANERDEGHYECQVSSHPPLVFHVFLKIIGTYSCICISLKIVNMVDARRSYSLLHRYLKTNYVMSRDNST